MSELPPARRRPGSGSRPSAGRPAAPRSTGAQRAVPGSGSRPAVRGGSASEARLVCTAGPKAGTEFPLSGDEEIVAGRANENPISVPDTSVSRRHFSVQKGAGGWEISDLGSGNGTLLNAERLEAPTALHNGDVITAGDSEFTFEDVANATAPRALPARRSEVPARRSQAGRPDVRARLNRSGAPAMDPARKKKIILLSAVAGVVILGGLVTAKVVSDRNAEALRAQQLVEQARRGELATIFQDGKNLVRDGQWTDAKVKFEEIIARAPNYPGVKDYLDRANIEIPNQQYLADAEAALKALRLGDAAAAIGKVKSTQQFEKLRDVKSGLDKALTSQLREAMTLMNAVGDKDVRRAAYVKAQEISGDILRVDPEHRDAKIVSENAARQIEIIDAPPVVVVGPAPKPWVPVIDRYLDGDVTGALAMADACGGKDRKCRDLAKEIREFAALYKRVEELDVRGLDRLMKLDRSIGDGRRSKMGQVAGTRAATAFYKNASAAKVAGQWGKAMDWAKKALQAEPGHAPSQAIVQEVSGKARDVYMLGYQLEPTSPDDAAVKYREVMVMTSPGDEYHGKAKSRLANLER